MEKEFVSMPIGYVGEVHISFKRNGRVYESYKHNAGVAGLFKFVCKALAGKDVHEECPKLIDLKVSIGGGAYTSILSTPIQLSGGTYYQESGDWLYKASATIPASSLTESIADLGDVPFRLYLSSKVGNTIIDFAHLQLEAADLENITPGTQALVEWVLRFQNLDGSQN